MVISVQTRFYDLSVIVNEEIILNSNAYQP